MPTNTVELIGKVIFAKGRVWTIYSTLSNPIGVFCYQGLKPYLSYKFDSHRTREINTALFLSDEFRIIEGEEIDNCMKQMESEDKKKLTRKKAIEFYVYLTGHTKSFVARNLLEKHHSFNFSPGQIRYELWKSDGALLLSHDTNGGYTQHTYFDFITFRHHDPLNEKSKEAIKEEVIENYKLSQ